jgi:signal transduction histidine kinase
MKSTLRILCLEDDEEDFEFINYTLAKSELSVNTQRVDTKEKYLEALLTFKPDVILSDHRLPLFDSTEALDIFQQMNLQVPFILVTGAVSDEFAVSCMKLGADDYVLKSNLKRLPSAIESALKHKETERAKLQATTALALRNSELLKINQELDTFVYSVSHNLRAPLMSVLGLLNLAKEETAKENLDQYHQLMETSIHKLDDTLKEILNYSRNARQELKIEQIDLNLMIKDNLEKIQFMPGFESLQIKVSINQGFPFRSDAYRISVIMNNLISNAVKYLDPTKSTNWFNIQINVDAQKATLDFQDNGIGINDRLTPKIFDMFYRATDKKEGSGLGLYIVKEAIGKLNGKIETQSKIGEGTLFHLELPNYSVDPKGLPVIQNSVNADKKELEKTI